MPDHVDYRVAVWSASPKKKEKEELDQLSVITEQLTILVMNIEALSTVRGRDFAT